MKKIISFILFLSIVLTLCIPSFAASNSEQAELDDLLKVYFFDVGQGDSTYIEFPNGENMLIDAGEKDSGVTAKLKKLGVKSLDYVFATHPHSDHIGGMTSIVNNFNIDDFYMPNAENETSTFENMLDALDNKDVNVIIPTKGDTIDVGEATLEIMSPRNGANYSDINDYSIVIRLDYGDTSFLFEGDASKNIENNFRNLDVDVLKVSHHGSDTASSQSFIKNTTPEYVVISCGKDNPYGHPVPTIVERYKDLGAEIFITMEVGDILIESDGKKIITDVEPNVGIDAIIDSSNSSSSTNSSSSNSSGSSAVSAAPDEEKEDEAEVQSITASYIGNKNTKKYHRTNCSSVDDMKESNKVPLASKAEAEEKGYVGCKRCNP